MAKGTCKSLSTSPGNSWGGPNVGWRPTSGAGRELSMTASTPRLPASRAAWNMAPAPSPTSPPYRSPNPE
eukprot:2731599-Lingulodinium_polyedra.AAC.1